MAGQYQGSVLTGRNRRALPYVAFDWLAAVVAWSLFFFYRKYVVEHAGGTPSVRFGTDGNLFLGLSIVPAYWLLLYTFAGTYKDVYRKSRLGELGGTLLVCALGVMGLFFLLLIDDVVESYRTYYTSTAVLFAFHFVLTAILRFVMLTRIARKIASGKVRFRTLLVGSNGRAAGLLEEVRSNPKPLGYEFVGYVDHAGTGETNLDKQLKRLGGTAQLPIILRQFAIEEVIIAMDTSEHTAIKSVIDSLQDEKIIIKVVPDLYDIVIGSVKMEHIFGAILIEIRPEIMPAWQMSIKRGIDIASALFVLTVMSPLLAYCALKVRLSSPGPIIFTQKRVGFRGKEFKIYKFRSMYVDAERMGPALSSENDPRITPWGLFMRRIRLDELPQFWNVLIGEMSLVGPRPERQHYIDQISAVAPHYNHLHKVKPGITGWGQVKYGYAENVSQMVQRLKWDILYIENMSLLVDFKILVYTVLIILEGRGK